MKLTDKFLLFTLPVLLAAQVAQKANETYHTEQGRATVAAGLTGPDRDEKQKPRELIDALKIKSGMSVADLGTGVGYMLPFLSSAVGSSGHVYAEDIFPDFLGKAKQRGADLKLNNVTYVLGTDRDPKLPAGKLDLVLALDVYHHFDYPDVMLAHIKQALAPNGRFAIVEYFKTKEAMPNGRALEHIRLNDSDMIREIESHGFKLEMEREHVPHSQYLAVFRPQ